MEVYEFRDGWDKIKVKFTKTGGVYVDMPLRFGRGGVVLRDSIVREERGWRFSSTQDDCIDYYFNMWLDDDGTLSWVNDMMYRRQYATEKFNPDYPNAGVLNDTAIKLYNVSQRIKNYQNRMLPTHEIFELRQLYLKTALKMLGYDSVDAVGGKLDDSRGYFCLTKVVDALENYVDLSRVVYSLGKAGDYDLFQSRIAEDATRESVLEFAKPVKYQIDEFVKYMKEREDGLQEKRLVYPEYKRNMSVKAGEYTWDEYEEKLKAVAMLLLELNADLLTEEQRAKFGIEQVIFVDAIESIDKISKLIDTQEFNDVCRIEDEFVYEEAEELVRRISNLNNSDNPAKEAFSREDVVRLLSSEMKELEERKNSVDVQETLHKKYYSRKSKQHVKVAEDEYVL